MLRVPFSSDDFFGVFTSYNHAVWPAQLLLLAAAVAALGLAVWRGERASRWVWGYLALLWVWSGVVYHLLHFTRINPAAFAFGGLFVLQGALLLWRGVVRGQLYFDVAPDRYGVTAGVVLAYALVIYPILGLLTGHGFFESPTFGAPCPVVIYTFGMLLLAPAASASLFVVPAAWAVLGFSAVINFGVAQDVGLPLSGIAAVALLIHRRRAQRAEYGVAAA